MALEVSSEEWTVRFYTSKDGIQPEFTKMLESPEFNTQLTESLEKRNYQNNTE